MGGCVTGYEVLTIWPTLQGSNGTFLLSLRGTDAEAFSVSPERAAGSAEVQVLVKIPSLVDYETKTVMLVQVRGALGHQGAQAMVALVSMLLSIPHPQVVATDSVSGNSSVALVTIHLRDINDHSPTFPHSLYNLSVPEHSPNGFVVTDSIHVSDEGQSQDEDVRDRVKMGWRYAEKGRPGTIALPESPYHLMPSGPRKCASCVSAYGGCVGMPVCASVSGFSLCIRKQDSFVPSHVVGSGCHHLQTVCHCLCLCLIGL